MRLGEGSRWSTQKQHGISLPQIALYHTVLVYKRILSAANHHINITKFKIPQVIAG